MAFSGITLAEAVYNNEAEAQDELSFHRGDIVTVIQKDYGADGWWLCQLGNKQGIVPFNYVRELSDEEMVRMIAGAQHQQPSPAMDSPYQTPSNRKFMADVEQYRKEYDQDGLPVAATAEPLDHRRFGARQALEPSATSIADSGWQGMASSGQSSSQQAGPSMTLADGQLILKRANATLDSCSARSLSVVGLDVSRLDSERLQQASRTLIEAGREAHTVLKDLISLSYDVLRVARQKKEQYPQLGQQLVRPIKPIKEAHVELAAAVAELEKGVDAHTSRQVLQKIHSLLTSVRTPVHELSGHVFTNSEHLFLPQDSIYQELPDKDQSMERTPVRSKTPVDSTDGGVPQRSASCDLLERQEQSPSAQRQTLVKRPSQLSDTQLTSRSPPRDYLPIPSANLSGSVDSITSGGSAASRHSSSSGNEPAHETETLTRPCRSNGGGRRPMASALGGLHVTSGDLTDGELSLLAYYAERMETLIPSVTNAVEAFCRAISEKQVPKQFVWHSKMVVVGAYKMVYVADTVFQKLAHAELRNHIVACSNRLVESIKNIVEFTKVAAQQYPSVGAMRDMVESVSHLPPLALDLAESIKEAASLR